MYWLNHPNTYFSQSNQLISICKTTFSADFCLQDHFFSQFLPARPLFSLRISSNPLKLAYATRFSGLSPVKSAQIHSNPLKTAYISFKKRTEPFIDCYHPFLIAALIQYTAFPQYTAFIPIYFFYLYLSLLSRFFVSIHNAYPQCISAMHYIDSSLLTIYSYSLIPFCIASASSISKSLNSPFLTPITLLVLPSQRISAA